MSSKAEIGGIPLGIMMIRTFLPATKDEREASLRPLALFLSYMTYLFFSAGKRPIFMIRMKILEACNGSFGTAPEGETWCEDTVFQGHADTMATYMGPLFILSYGFAVFFSGVLTDSFNPRYIITTGGIMSGFFSMIIGLANLWKIKSVQYFAMAHILLGVSHSTAWPVVLSSATHWYSSPLKRGIFFAFWNTHNFLGNALGTVLSTIMVQKQWGWSFIIPGILVVLSVIVCFLFLVVHPTDLRTLDEEEVKKEDEVVPQWLDNQRSIDYQEVLQIPGVIEYSLCMFFLRMVSFMFLFWHPLILQDQLEAAATTASYYTIFFSVGGAIGGVLAGFLKDTIRKSALVCCSLQIISIPVMGLQLIRMKYDSWYVNSMLQVLTGVFVDGPFVLLSTAVSVDLGTHSLIRRGTRGLATVASIIEGFGSLGAFVGPIINQYFVDEDQWQNAVFLMMAVEFCGCITLLRRAGKEFKEKSRRLSMGDYWEQEGPEQEEQRQRA